jgi:hypothetical protein
MADNLVTLLWTSGLAIDLYILNTADQYYNGTIFETLVSGHWTNYATPFQEAGSTGVYAVAFPSLPAGVYLIIARQRLAGAPAETDPIIGSDSAQWNGTSFITPSNVLSNGTSNCNLLLVQGDDYFAADGRAIVWTLANVPDLTGASISFTAQKRPQIVTTGSATITATGGVVVPSGASKLVQLELPSATTATFAIGANGYTYELVATLASGHVVTLATGNITVKA